MQFRVSTTHTAPGATFTVGAMSNPTAPYLARAATGDPFAIAHLAKAGIVPHYPTTDPCPFGSTWTLEADGWHETPSGTPEAIAAALEAAAAQAVIDARATLSCSTLQAMKAIDAMGYVAVYESWTTDPARTFVERAFIRHATLWERLNPVFLSVVAMLGKTDEEADAFILAAREL